MKTAIASILIMTLTLAACAQAPDAQETVKIGFIGPLTGEAANYGQSALAAAEFAVQEINDAGGVNGKPVELAVEDTKCDGTTASTVVNKLINVDRVQVIVGSLCSSDVLAAAPIAEQANVVLVSYGASSPKVTDAGDYIFRTYPSDAYVAKFLATYLSENGYESVGILACLDEYCQGLADTFEKEFKGTITGRADVEKESADVRSDLLKLKQDDPDALLTPLWTTTASATIKQSNELKWDVPIFGADSMADPEIAKAVGDSGKNVRLAMVDINSMTIPALSTYLESKSLGNVVGTPQAYDTIRVIADVMGSGATTGPEIRDALYAMPTYDGVSGPIAFDENGDLREGTYTWYEYRDGELAVLE